MKNVKAKKGFTASRSVKSRGATKRTIVKKEIDPLAALIKQTKAVSMDGAAKPMDGDDKPKRSLSKNRSAVRKKRKVKVAGAKRKQRRKGIN